MKLLLTGVLFALSSHVSAWSIPQRYRPTYHTPDIIRRQSASSNAALEDGYAAQCAQVNTPFGKASVTRDINNVTINSLAIQVCVIPDVFFIIHTNAAIPE